MNAPNFAGRVVPEPQAERDVRFMTAALAIGRRNLGQAHPNPAVGTLVVKTDGDMPVVIARGCTARGGRPHAETEALKAAGDAARGSTLYVTLEPCAHYGKTPPCAHAIVATKVARVVVAVEDFNPQVQGLGMKLLRDAGIETVIGVGADEAMIDHAGHFRRMSDGRPHIILKLAVSADGKTGLAGRKPAQISGPISMAEAHILRSTSDAVLVGSGTVLADDPRLDCRLPGMSDRSPIRIVLDGGLRIPITSNLVRTAREIPVWAIANEDAPEHQEAALNSAGVEVIRVAKRNGGTPDLPAIMRLLGSRGVTRLLVEGGPILSAALLQNDLVDEAVVVQAPVTLGDDALGALEGLPLDALLMSPKLRVLEERALGQDRMMRLFRK